MIAVIVVIILVVAVLELLPTPTATMTVSTTATNSYVGQNLTFAAFISGGTPSKVVFNFGDGTTGNAKLISGNEYAVTHSYSSAGRYLVTANASVNGKYLNNLNSIIEVTVTPPASISAAIASKLTQPSIVTSSQIYSEGSTATFTGTILQPPTAANWTVGYYIWSFGSGSTTTNYAVMNTSSGDFMTNTVLHTYNTPGIFVVTLGVITFDATGYVPSTYTSNGINYTYYPVSDLSSILSSENYNNNTYYSTIVVNKTGQIAQLLKSTVSNTNPSQIVVTEVASGGAYSFDPATAYGGSYGMILNVYQLLLQYNGSSTTKFIPIVASEVPSTTNGGISSNYLNYTFDIRSGSKFANGDPLTAWDVYTSFIRTLLFVADSPGTAGWIVCQDLLPGGGFAPGATSYQNVTSAISVDNATQTVTFHLLKQDPAFLEYVSDEFGASIMDYSWLVAHGAGITFTPAGFSAYISEGNSTNYNAYIEYHMMGSGPYMIKNYIIGQSITLMPNPYYTPLPGIAGYNHAANDTIYMQWEKDPDTALLIAETGLTDIIQGLPNYDYPALAHLESEGKLNITAYPSLTLYWFQFNFNVNTTLLSTLGSTYSIPQYYFANLDVRRAWAYAFNYTNYIDNLLGNSVYGADFGFVYAGGIPLGMGGYINSTQLQQAGAVVPTCNLATAKQYMEESGLYNQTINIPIVVWAADPVDYAAAVDWGATMHSIDPNIEATGLYMEIPILFGYMVGGANPMPISLAGWSPDFPFPSDYILPMYQEYGYYGSANGWTPQVLTSVGQTAQAAEDTLMNQYIADAQSTGNVSLAFKYYDQAEVLGVNLTFYTYTYQENDFWVYSPLLHGFQQELNPIYGGDGDIIYLFLSK